MQLSLLPDLFPEAGLYSAKDCARILGCHVETFRRWAKRYRLKPAFAPSRRFLRYSAAELKKLGGPAKR
jgi:DNA-binding transcriptional MerR regulator